MDFEAQYLLAEDPNLTENQTDMLKAAACLLACCCGQEGQDQGKVCQKKEKKKECLSERMAVEETQVWHV